VRQVLTNLLSNAAKFTERGKIVLAPRREGDRVSVSVRDTGVGIREEDLEHLYSAFHQLEDAKTKKHEGTGLGLAITRELLGLLQGSIEVASVYGEGTTFTVSFPLRLQNPREAANA
jgi:signal transduction histidine kinase